MRIATYNIWNSSAGMPRREELLVNQIKEVDADIIGLQEVKDREYSIHIAKASGYEHSCFESHAGRKEGIAILSRQPIKSYKYTDFGLIAMIDNKGNDVMIVNVHLPWDSVLAQEKSIVNIIGEISHVEAQCKFILGDFNCSEVSSVHQYLSGFRSLRDTEVKAYWTDLASVAEEFYGVKKENTLDFKTNPRFIGESVNEASTRVDCIFVHDSYPKEKPSLLNFFYYGKEVDSVSGMCPSDHYGAAADLKMPEEI